MSIARPRAPVHPALINVIEERAKNTQNRIADRITRSPARLSHLRAHRLVHDLDRVRCGSVPFGLLTMIVSLEPSSSARSS